MATLVIENVPASLYDRIQDLAKARHRTPAAAVLEVLELAIATAKTTQAPFLTEEICAPCEIPRPEGETVVPIEIAHYLPEPHDIPDVE